MTPPVTLVVSIDTEEDNWRPARTGITVDNVRELPRLHRLLERLGVRPTYFATYHVASDARATEILREIHERGAAEIGAHLHPWNTPPLDEAFVPANTMTLNLPQQLQAAKILRLTEALVENVGERPTSFRAGRWGFGRSTAAALLECGYRVDSSVTPFMSWVGHDGGPSHVGAPLDVYRLDERGDPRGPVAHGKLVEVPVSCGYSRGSMKTWASVHAILAHPAARRMRLVGIASRLGLIRHITLSPETDSVGDMIVLSRRLIALGVRLLHVTLHSSSLRPGLTPFAATAADAQRVYKRFDAYLERLLALAPVRFATIREAATMLAPPLPTDEDTRSRGKSARERRLVVISYHHPPDGFIGGLRWAGLTKYLARLGWKSWVVTAAPPPEGDGPNGVNVVSCPRRATLHDLYRSIRLPSSARAQAEAESFGERHSDGGGGVFDRLRLEGDMLLSLPDQGRGWILRAAARARALVAELQPDAVVSTGPPHSAHLVAWLATRGFQTRWLADFRDPWAGPMSEAWRDSPQYRSALCRWFTQRAEQLVLKSVSAAVCNTREFAAALAARYASQTVHWLPNAVDRDLLPSPNGCRFPGLAVAYVGTLYGGRDLGPVLQALRIVLDRGPGVDGNACKLRIAGSIEGQQAQKFGRDVDALGLRDHVESFGALSRDAALMLLARSRLGIVLAQKQELQIPAKLYELMGIGIPTVVIAAAGSAAYGEAVRLGAIALEPDDVRGLAEVMEQVWAERLARTETAGAVLDYNDLASQVAQLLAP